MDTTQAILAATLSALNDSVHIVLHNAGAVNPTSESAGFNFKPFAIAIGAIVAAIIGGFVAIWSKSKDFETFNENLKLQKQLLNETIQNNEHRIKAEIIRLQDLRKEYELNISKHGHEKLRDVLKYASHETPIDKDKVAAIKKFSLFLDMINPNTRNDFDDYSDYEEWITIELYHNLNKIDQELTKYLSEFPHVFTKINERIADCKDEAVGISIAVNRHVVGDAPFPDNEDICKESDRLINLYSSLKTILKDMTTEFKDLESLRNKFVNEHKKDDPTTA